MAPKDKGFQSVRRGIELAMEQAVEERRRKLLSSRLEVARVGIAAYQRKDIAVAVKSFHSYFRVLEELKNVAEGTLTPSCFDLKKERSELLVISAIYWDLVKLYDRTQSAEKRREFNQYLEKYIIFSKGMPFQALCAETLRKYISREKPVHRAEFNHAYSVLSESHCFVATVLVGEISEETLPLLRKLRDTKLKQFPAGRFFIKWYYKNGPKIAQIIRHFPRPFRRILGIILDFLAVLGDSKILPSISVDQSTDSLRSEDELGVRKADPKR